jgi:hypothetical protein
MRMNHAENTVEIVGKLESLEREMCNLALIFAEMFKDEINANDEMEMYNGIKDVIKKYSGDKRAVSLINEYTRAISGGASLDEILQLTMDEARYPTLASEITVDKKCNLTDQRHNQTHG